MFPSESADLIRFKVVILGDSQVGKTSIISRQMRERNPEVHTPTVGCDCSELYLSVDDQRVVLQVWDTAGQEVYRALVPVYLRGAHAAILVYDVADLVSFEAPHRWHNTLLEVLPTTTSVFIVGNKTDLDEVVDEETVRGFCADHNFLFFKVSAVTGIGLNELFEEVARQVVVARKDEMMVPVLMEPESKSGCGC
jgi:small GTP-binding protein